MNKKAFASCMKRNREKQKLTLNNLEMLTGISIQRLREFESGEFEEISVHELESLSKEIKVPVLILVKGGGVVHSLSRDESGGSHCERNEY